MTGHQDGRTVILHWQLRAFYLRLNQVETRAA